MSDSDESHHAVSPEIPVQETFYLRQLTVNVFNIHDCKTEKGMFYVYHEGIARKGPNEVCSNLVHYLKNKLDEKIRHLHLFSDGCGGQNKNHCLVRVMLMLIATGRFDSITHYFPQRGHSYLPSDRDFHVVKSKLRKIDRIYTVNEYKDLIIESSAKNRFEVQLVSSGDILDYKTWWPNFYRKNVISKETSGRTTPRQMKKSFSISEFSEFKYSKEHIGSVQVKKYIDGLETHTFVLANACVIPSEPHGAYSEDCVPINIKKMDDIKKFKTYLPETEEVKNFYDIIFSIPVIEQNDD